MNPTQRPKEDQNFWNFIFTIFFIGVGFAALWYMREARGGYLVSVPPFDTLLMALASFRVTRLVVYDKIARWFRELFATKREFSRDGRAWVEVVAPPRGFRHTVYDLLQCPWCIGIWSSLIVVFCYFIYPWAWSVIFFLAVAGAGSFIQIIANAIGWRAENLKMDWSSRSKE